MNRAACLLVVLSRFGGNCGAPIGLLKQAVWFWGKIGRNEINVGFAPGFSRITTNVKQKCVFGRHRVPDSPNNFATILEKKQSQDRFSVEFSENF